MNKAYTIDANRVVWRLISDEAVVLNLKSGHYYGLNKTCSMIWSLLSRNKTLEEIAAAIAKKYGISPEVVSADVSSVVETFEREGLIAQENNVSA